MESPHKKFVFVALLFVTTIFSNEVFVQFSNGQSLCNMSAAGLMACKPAVTAPNPTLPSTGCCTALSHADIGCLCSYKNSTVLPRLGIDPNLAMQLPAKCNLPHPANC